MKKKLFTRNFTLLLLGQASSLVGNYTLRFALSMLVLEETGSASVFGGILAVSMVPTILLSPLGGVLADRANRRNIMVALDVLSGTAVLGACLLFPWGNRLFLTGTLLVALSILGAFESPTVQACVPQMLEESLLLKGNAAVNQISAAASLVTPFLGSVLYTVLGIQPVLAGAAACFFLTAALESLFCLEHCPSPRKEPLSAILKNDLSQSVRFLLREEPDLVRLLLLAALASLFAAGTAVVGLPYLVRTTLGLSAQHYGAAESAMGVAAILGGVLVALLGDRLGPERLSAVFVGIGLCLAPCGMVFLLSASAVVRYGVLVALFCSWLYDAGIFVFCGACGALFASGLLESAALESWLRIVILLAVFVAVGFLALKFVRPVMILATGFSGASSILSSLLLMGVAIPAGLVQLAVMLVLAAVGIGVQFATTR